MLRRVKNSALKALQQLVRLLTIALNLLIARIDAGVGGVVQGPAPNLHQAWHLPGIGMHTWCSRLARLQ
jgi:hypothetical protein